MFGQYWYACRDADKRALGLYKRHYSAQRNRTFPRQRAMRLSRWEGGISGCGDHMALLTVHCDALFCWKRYTGGVSRDGKQVGVVCSVFRNEGPVLSSLLIREACELAWERWPGERLYTYVDPTAIRSTNPGYCFKQAGWRPAGTNADGSLLILEYRWEWHCG